MQAVRHRAAAVARQTRPTTTLRSTRSYSSDHGHGHHQPPANESFGYGFYAFVAALPASILLYKVSQPAKEGEQHAITKWIQGWSDMKGEWERRNQLHDEAVREAAAERHLFLHSAGPRHVELKTPELLQSYSPINVSPGSVADMSKVVEHYRTQYHEEELRKAEKLAAAKKD